ncbi:SAM-dependent methyltransferase [Halomonas sp. 141]|uniref:SAM-dependent methyltransferase n=1 Tax=Halomonas sp. 141 TaxID=2056666 RepID=UPI000C2B26B4|nr:SAM-dependent methyltransferase [Halomonas sp. 141]PJX13508.1 SAM-dependent methyltransferase [Halomonas sp. 141]
MQSDFLDAHNRHWQDAEQLFEAGRWANADHLFGMAAECGLKRLMLAFGMEFDTDKNRPEQGQDRRHADGIWTRYEAYRSGHHQGACYGLSADNPFQDWEVSQRYANQSHFDQAHVEPHRSGAEQVRQRIRRAQQEGLI